MPYIFQVEAPATQSMIESVLGLLFPNETYLEVGTELAAVKLAKPLYEVPYMQLAELIQQGINKETGSLSYEEIFNLEGYLSKAMDSAPASLLSPLTSLLEEFPTLLACAALEGSTVSFIHVT